MNQTFAQLGFGGAALSSLKSYPQAARLLETAYDLGIRHFDTAPSYGQGYSEVIYGKFIKNKRSDITITTKFGRGNLPAVWLPVQLAMPLNYWRKKWQGAASQELSSSPKLEHRYINKQEIKIGFEASLQRLQTDYVDYYFLHETLPNFLTEEALAYLLDLKKGGRIRHLGIGTNIAFIQELDNETLSQWDVLQYEGRNPETVEKVLQRFPNKIHFHHSCLQELNKSVKGIGGAEKAGYLLANCAKRNPLGKVIFSTRKEAALRQNLAAYEKFI